MFESVWFGIVFGKKKDFSTRFFSQKIYLKTCFFHFSKRRWTFEIHFFCKSVLFLWHTLKIIQGKYYSNFLFVHTALLNIHEKITVSYKYNGLSPLILVLHVKTLPDLKLPFVVHLCCTYEELTGLDILWGNSNRFSLSTISWIFVLSSSEIGYHSG